MKDRLITFALAIGAFLLFYALFVPKPAQQDDTLSLPTSIESKPDGYQALWRWLQAEHIPAVSFRDRYERLTQRAPSSTGNILIATLPQQLPARPDELQELDKWIQRGNTLVIMAALDDTPQWALSAQQAPEKILQRMTRMKFFVKDAATDASASSESSSDNSDDAEETDTQEASEGVADAFREAFERLLEPERSSIEPLGAHPLFAGVQSVATISEFPASRWHATVMDTAAVLAIGQRPDTKDSQSTEPKLWLKRQGDGQVIICAFASPFSNRMLGEQDNARLFANIVGWSRGAQGAVLFDDAHQGLVSYYDARAFFADPRLHRTLLWIGLLWLLFVLGWQRFRPQLDTWTPIDVTTFIKVTGGFLADSLTTAATAQRLLANFFNDLRRRLGLPEDGQPVWDWLATQAGLSQQDLLDLQRLHTQAHSRKRIDLVYLQNRLATLMRQLA